MKLRLATPLTVSGRVIVETIEGAPTPSAPSVLLIKQHGGQILYSEQAIFTAQAEEDGRILLPTCSNPADTAARLLPASQSATSGPRDVSCRTSNPCPEPHFSIAPRTLPPWVLLGPLPDQRRPPGRVGRGLSMRRCYRGPLAQASAPAKSRRWICPSPRAMRAQLLGLGGRLPELDLVPIRVINPGKLTVRSIHPLVVNLYSLFF